uniref:glycine rich domain-containing protein n=1 Tax=Odoribacter lunatus TaxID=2941335 RepID=UPI00203DA689
YVKKPGEAKFDIIPDANGESLVYNNFVNTGSSFVTYQFKRTGICAVGMAETVTNVYVAPLPWTNSLDTYTNVYPSFTVNSTWGNMPQAHWKLETPPAGISISNHGVVAGLTSNSVFWADVTVSSDKCPGQSWTKKLEVRREFYYTGSSQSITLAPGKYKMECWGAEGGIGYINQAYPGNPGNGGYSYGELQLTSSTAFYIYVGGRGGNAKKNCKSYCGGGAAGWNGGGRGGHDDNDDNGGGGGGASDIRLVSGNLYSRIMVAGGGGGARGGTSTYGGSGGGVWGGGTTGAGQTGNSAYFGQGAAGGKGGSATGVYGGGGGGGGYYGAASNGRDVGCGGSGFVSGMSGCNAITGDGNLAPTGQPNHYSGLVFQNASMSSGTRIGNGLVRISPVIP